MVLGAAARSQRLTRHIKSFFLFVSPHKSCRFMLIYIQLTYGRMYITKREIAHTRNTNLFHFFPLRLLAALCFALYYRFSPFTVAPYYWCHHHLVHTQHTEKKAENSSKMCTKKWNNLTALVSSQFMHKTAHTHLLWLYAPLAVQPTTFHRTTCCWFFFHPILMMCREQKKSTSYCTTKT